MRSFDATFAFACSLALGLGCATVQHIHRPPTPAEIREINASQSPIVVEPLPIPGREPSSWKVDRVVFADAVKVVVAPVDGPPYAFPLYDVSNFHLRRTGRGAAIGAVWGAGLGAIEGVFLLLYLSGLSYHAPNEMPDTSFPTGAAVGFAAVGALIGAGVGASIGAATGAPENFRVTLGPAPPSLYAPFPEPALKPPTVAPPALPPSPPPMRTATVVAPSAEVHSAPFKVAPVVATLARGQSLSVAPTPKAGWRVVYLSDGRVGYIEDLQVEVGSP